MMKTKYLPGIWGDGQHDDTAGIQGLLDRGLSCVSLPPPQKHYIARGMTRKE